MKNGRLFELLYLLVERRALTAGELAERFGLTEDFIRRAAYVYRCEEAE